ncbi:MAG: hypothetical protein CL607_02850 [Anaerolineaceae bacterium]|nr:hypothetical protein [Anaerolineaceae bacterium]
MKFLRAFLIFNLNAVILTLSFLFVPGMYLGIGNVFVILFLSMLMTWLTWVIWNYSLTRKAPKQKRKQADSDLADLEARLARLETIAAAGYVNGQRPERVELEERLARLENIAAAEHLSDHPEDWDQIDIKRKRGLN